MRLWVDKRGLAALLAVVTFALVIWNQRDVGIARDETVYFRAGDQYVAWWSDLVHARGAATKQAIGSHWGGADNNSEHPPLMKTLFGLSERIFHGGLGIDPITAYRIPSALLHALLIAMVFWWAASIWGAWEGLVAALLLLFMPRLLFHAGLACFDAPMVALWFLVVVAYQRALSSRRWAIVAGVAFGLALATKHNALLLPPALVVHALVVAWAAIRIDWRELVGHARTAPFGRKLPAYALAGLRTLGRRLTHEEAVALLAMALIGPLVLIALWPWLWFDTFAHVRDWLAFHLHHVHYNFEYLGQNWNHPPFPWHVVVITTLFTVPVVTLAAAALGTRVMVTRAWRERQRPVPTDATRPGLLLFLSAAAAMGPFLLGSTPIFGAEKHWAPAMPSFAIAAGVGAVWAGRQLAAALLDARTAWRARETQIETACIALVAAALVGAAAVETVHAQPYALSEYNALAGGAPGGADLGMNRQFWGYAAKGVLPFLRTQAPSALDPPRPVYSHDASPAWGWYQRDGEVLAGMPDAGPEQLGVDRSELAIVVHELHFNRHDYMIWKSYGTVQPVFVLRADGVPIVSVYRRPHRAAAAPASTTDRSR